MVIDPQKYAGTLFIHTPKAIRVGAPDYRLYCITEVITRENRVHLIAWLADRIAEEEMEHGALGRVQIKDTSAEELCHPTEVSSVNYLTVFRPDSFYRQVTLEKALKLLVPIN